MPLERQAGVGRNKGSAADTMQRGEDLPSKMVDRFTKPLVWFFKIEAAAAGMLLLATIAAMILSNSAWSSRLISLVLCTTGSTMRC
jgi:hypothetical protein